MGLISYYIEFRIKIGGLGLTLITVSDPSDFVFFHLLFCKSTSNSANSFRWLPESQGERV